MRVAVLGGGLQGCCTALALAERGVNVTLFDRNERLLSRAAVANEGKVHLGFLYAGDPGLATADRMMTGALAFAPFFVRHLGVSVDAIPVSEPATYLVHRDSQKSPDEVLAYLDAVHARLREAAAIRPDAYFGVDLGRALEPWPRARIDAAFGPDCVLAAVTTPEVAINPVTLAERVREVVMAHPRIEKRLRCIITSAKEESSAILVAGEDQGEAFADRFDHAVNALWEGRLALNATIGLETRRPWLHRLKYGVSFRLPADATPPPSVVVVLGPFGEVVGYGAGLIYLTWYPTCLHGISREMTPPHWPTHPPEPLHSRIFDGTLRALGTIVPELRKLDRTNVSEQVVKGGVVVAWGKTDIDDPLSELHRRSEIGVTSVGRFHSIDPGKLTMAPYFAEMCADRVRPAE